MSIILKIGSLDLPSPPSIIFGRDAPFAAEIGIGSGRFIDDFARIHPDWNVLGMDRAPGSVVRSFRRLHRSGRNNARIIKADATFVLRDVIPPSTLDLLFVNFPDPWPRRKHRGRRLLQKDQLVRLSTRLIENGRILLTSDHPEYFEFTCRTAVETGLYRVEERSPPAEVLGTKYAKKWTEREFRIHHAAFIKEAEANGIGDTSVISDDVRLEVVDAMHHAVLEGHLPDLSDFQKRSFSFENGTAVVLDAYQPLREKGYVFLVHVEESGLHQEIVIEARPGKRGFVVGVKRFGEPLHTRGVGHSVRCVAEWLASHGMRIVHRKY